MRFKTINDLMNAEFIGFVSVAELWGGAAKAIPFAKGVYMVVHPVKNRPKFLEIGTGGYFKGMNPNKTVTVKAGKPIKVNMSSAGGYIAVIRPE